MHQDPFCRPMIAPILCNPPDGFQSQDDSVACALTCFHAVNLRVLPAFSTSQRARLPNWKVCNWNDQSPVPQMSGLLLEWSVGALHHRYQVYNWNG